MIQITDYNIVTIQCLFNPRPLQATLKKNLNLVRFTPQDQIRENKNLVVRELEKKLSFREDALPRQQVCNVYYIVIMSSS